MTEPETLALRRIAEAAEELAWLIRGGSCAPPCNSVHVRLTTLEPSLAALEAALAAAKETP